MDETQPLLSPLTANGDGAGVTQISYDRVAEFDPSGDVDNPLEWPEAYKRGVIGLLAFMAFSV